METRVKERLTGAIILVAIVVIVVPALLTGPPRSTQPPEPAEGVTREMVIDLASQRPAQPEDPDQPQPEPEASRPPPAATAATAPAADGGIAVAPTGVPEAGAGGAPPPGVVALPPDPAPASTAATPPAAATSPPGTTASPPAAAAPGPTPAWAVQLGAFSRRETAQQLVDQLKGRGYAAFWLEYRADGKVLYRVRVGPEQDRARAEAIAGRLRSEGQTRATVAPHP